MRKNKSNISVSCSFEIMNKMIRQGEHWVRNDWKEGNKYVILADDRCCTPCLLLVMKETNEYLIYQARANDYKYGWSKVNGK